MVNRMVISTEPAMSMRTERARASNTSKPTRPLVPVGISAFPNSVSKKALAISPGSSDERFMMPHITPWSRQIPGAKRIIFTR
jgi:hypothetical protein